MEKRLFQAWTSARVAMGRTGGSLPCRERLRFLVDHARARDAVHAVFDPPGLAVELEGHGLPVMYAPSRAADRQVYLQRPDWGRQLGEGARERLEGARGDYDLVVVVADGLSAEATHRQAPPLLEALFPLLRGWELGPLVISSQARVALEDEIGEALGARAVLMLLGERPGLGSPDSLGAYLVQGPRRGNSDAQRNCVSNIRPAGLPVEAAAQRIAWLLGEARRLGFSGVDLKDESGAGGGLDFDPCPDPGRLC
ncbi:ethanolamine ammonia-lyase small subunit [Haloferula luteola]|uniref:Ethanolamine ammonia-lyase small subunit n=1 Tax=Haloferula luteola TaxID=595692 RepID=A0A840V8A5_9BACT|nr:ethanolamine ammonia-lyase subunit EutC [Haloferula luteola]MBB5350968.1 ethanolamine ammonia-lyase small subunit [Haloferula luteola]